MFYYVTNILQHTAGGKTYKCVFFSHPVFINDLTFIISNANKHGITNCEHSWIRSQDVENGITTYKDQVDMIDVGHSQDPETAICSHQVKTKYCE